MSDKSPILFEVEENHPEILNMLIKTGLYFSDAEQIADINEAVINCCINGREDCLTQIVKIKHLNLNVKDKDNMTPIKHAKKHGHSKIVNLLKKHGAIEEPEEDKPKKK